MTKTLKPVVKWAGGKTWLAPKLKELYDPSRRLVEPFLGGMAITLSLNPKKALLNDINPHLINLYTQIQNGLEIDNFVNSQECFYQIREAFNTNSENNSEKALQFYYLNKTCFNGLYRENKKGLFNVPYGKYKSINYASNFIEHSAAFQNWKFTNLDFTQLQIEDNDFVYADPPYDDGWIGYSKNGFSWDKQIELAHWLISKNVPVVASNKATDRIFELYRDLGFTIELLEAPRSISCNGNRQKVLEMLAYKNLAFNIY